MPNEPWWGWVLLGRLHPLIVHFPIGLILAGAVHEVVRWARRKPVPSEVGSFCLVLGLLSGALAVWLGTLNASHQSITGDSARILEWHRYAGWALLLVGAAAFLAGRVAHGRPGTSVAGLYTGLIAVAGVCVGVSGHFGGQLVYGSTYITSVLPGTGTTATARAGDVDVSPASAAPDTMAPAAPPEPVDAPVSAPAPGPVQSPSPAPVAATASPAPEPVAIARAGSDPPPAATSLQPVTPVTPVAPPPSAAQAVARVDFARDVRPLLDATCVECHGPEKVKARLRMDSIAALQQGGKSGPLVVAGDPENSLLMRRVLGLDDEDQMPLDNDPLTPAQLDVLRRWIAEGAHYTSRTGADSQP